MSAPDEVRFDWGPRGLEAAGEGSDVIVVVDVLSFSTAVDVAVGRGASVWPGPLGDPEAAALARRHGAQLASAVRRPTPDAPYSLSPASLRALPAGGRLVLPSPNGGALCAAARALGAVTLVGCLRNAAAVAAVAAGAGRGVAVVAAGERWPDGSLRPALEDLLGAGAVAAALGGRGRRLSPEARAAAAAFAGADLPADLWRTPSARELQARGFPDDVALAAASGASTAAPCMRADGWIVAGPPVVE